MSFTFAISRTKRNIVRDVARLARLCLNTSWLEFSSVGQASRLSMAFGCQSILVLAGRLTGETPVPPKIFQTKPRKTHATRLALTTALVVGGLCASAGAQDETPVAKEVSTGPTFVEITPESRAAVEKGLAFLAASQEADGSFAANGMGKNVGITGLACLAFMADGHLPGRGKYGANVQRGLEYVLQNVHENGLIAAGTSHGPMYGHGFATLFLGEIYGMTDDPRVREALIKAVRLIVASQNHEGGWRYQPVPMDADVSVTICQIMGLRSARDAGLAVPRETIQNAISYVRKCQNQGDGGFRYMLNSGGSAFPRSAAGVASLYYAGVYEDKALERGLNYLHRNWRPGAGRGGHFYYGQYYASQAMFLAGGKHWADWFPNIRGELIKQQQDDGGWASSYGTSYGSAMALLILQVPNRFLPIFQR